MSIKNIPIRVCAAFLLTLVSFNASAQNGREQLQNFFREVQSLKASFTQALLDAQGEPLQVTSGTVWLQRPGKFRWDYREPFPQLIVSNGNKVFLYDVDLEQVTVRPLDDALGNTPVLLLAGNEPLEKNFTIKELDPSDGLAWVELVPKAEDLVGFERMQFGFAGNQLKAMQMADNLGQITRLRFSDGERNVDIDANLFEFTPPKGVDVIGEP